MKDKEKTKQQLTQESGSSGRERKRTEKGLKTDFFGGLWNSLEAETQKLLVEIEVHWDKSQVREMLGDIRHVFQLELVAIFPSLAPIADLPDPSLVLTRMKEALGQYPVTRAYIDDFNIGNEDKAFLKHRLPDYLGKVIDCGDYFEKASHDRDQAKHSHMVAEAMDIRRNLLGIGREGILRRLAGIKRLLHSLTQREGGNLP